MKFFASIAFLWRMIVSKKLSCSFLLTSILCFGFSLPAMAEQSYFDTVDYNPFITEQVPKTYVSVDTGVRVNDFDWNIAADPTGTLVPNILSELTWSDITLFEVKGGVMHFQPVDIANFRGGFQVEGSLTYGEVLDGKNQDSDYLGNNRTLEFSRSNNSSDSGYAFSGEALIGYKMFLASGRTRLPGYGSGVDTTPISLRLMPLAGYGYHKQQYEMTDGVQTIPPVGAFDGLSSEYTAEWMGPFVGLETEFLLDDNQMFSVRGKYHKLDYDAEAVWNLRDNFQQSPSYKQDANDGLGLSLDAKYVYAFNPHSSVTLGLGFNKRNVEDGTDTIFFTDGSVGKTRLNEVNDKSTTAHVGYRLSW